MLLLLPPLPSARAPQRLTGASGETGLNEEKNGMVRSIRKKIIKCWTISSDRRHEKHRLPHFFFFASLRWLESVALDSGTLNEPQPVSQLFY